MHIWIALDYSYFCSNIVDQNRSLKENIDVRKLAQAILLPKENIKPRPRLHRKKIKLTIPVVMIKEIAVLVWQPKNSCLTLSTNAYVYVNTT
jgi:hypothetical protein